ncbi:DUF2612 domain-containing protein [Frateuria edaphi]|uniref:DUF2612 domain-containing protein n=1 Tax=Frateuria edaphi TaxID=2898793 RepID=UPI001E4FB575|nr:DUF2612 domain-containing protein [Frateuria edaphi]UGB47011.1 DUF2612 domain-containing protein [Frateuria edaphi]
MAYVATYTRLVTPQHADKPKYMAMLAAVFGCFVDQQNLLASLPATFDVDTAVGAQLDVVGQWVGVSREVSVPITGAYFAWDTAGLGWDQGNWQGPFDPTSGITALDDGTYRVLIKAKIGANHWDGTLPSAKAILDGVFTGGSKTIIQDNGNMTITFGVAGTQPSVLLRAILSQGLLPLKPEAVHVDGYVMTSQDGTPLFGLDVENGYIAGLDVGALAIDL